MRHAGLVATAWLAACASQTPPRPVSPDRTATHAPASQTATLAPASTSACRHHVPATCDGSPPGEMRDVLPIFEKRCFGCHTGDGVAAGEHDFSHVEALRAARTAIADEIATCSMPPRSPLGDGEANTLLLWATCAQGVATSSIRRSLASYGDGREGSDDGGRAGAKHLGRFSGREVPVSGTRPRPGGRRPCQRSMRPESASR
jgi:hypothetical protein